MLVHLPDGYKPEQVAPALAAKIQTLPEVVRRSLTWDQGPEMRDWKQVAIAADIEIFFCDPHTLAARQQREHLLVQGWPCRTSSTGAALVGQLGDSENTCRGPSVDLSTAAHSARALTGSDLIEAC